MIKASFFLFSIHPYFHPSSLTSLLISPLQKQQTTSQTTSQTPKNAIMVEPPLNEEECKIKKNYKPKKKGGGARFNLARYRAMEMDKKEKKRGHHALPYRWVRGRDKQRRGRGKKKGGKWSAESVCAQKKTRESKSLPQSRNHHSGPEKQVEQRVSH